MGYAFVMQTNGNTWAMCAFIHACMMALLGGLASHYTPKTPLKTPQVPIQEVYLVPPDRLGHNSKKEVK